MGAKVYSQGKDQPLGGNGEITIKTLKDVLRIPEADPASQGRMPLMLEALRRVKEAIGEEVFIVACFDQYPFSAASALMGIDRIMLRLYDDRRASRSLDGTLPRLCRGLCVGAGRGRRRHAQAEAIRLWC